MIESQQRVTSLVSKSDLLKQLCLWGVVFGVIVRLSQYFSNRSLWSDEAMLALNIVNRSYAELLKPLDYNQAAPPLFLWIEKLSVQLLGNTEYALRLLPLLAGLLSLVIFYKLAVRYTSAIAAPIAIALFACLKYPLYYATEVKQYSSDVMVALLLYLMLLPLRDRLLNRKQLLRLSLFIAVLIWLSHPAIFVLAGIEISYFLATSHQQRWKMVVNRLPMYITWLLSFAGLYFFTIRGTLGNSNLVSSWDRRYPDSLFDIAWSFDALGRFFYNPLGFPLGILHDVAIVAFLLGCIAFYRRNRVLLLTLLSPAMITLAASYLEKYPFRDRLVLFVTPVAILIIAEGIAFLFTLYFKNKANAKPDRDSSSSRSRSIRRYLPLISGVLIGILLLAPPAVRAALLIVHPTQVEEMRPVVAYVRAHQQPGDRLYVYRLGRNQFKYYAPRYGYTPGNYILGTPAMATGGGKNLKLSEKGIRQFQQDVRSFQGAPRVWFLFCRTSDVEEQTFLSTVNPIGRQLDAFKQTNAFVYLYDLQSPAKAATSQH